MEFIFYQAGGILLAVGIIKVIEFLREWNENRIFRKELPKRIAALKRRAELDARLNIMMCAMPFIMSAALRAKSKSEGKQNEITPNQTL